MPCMVLDVHLLVQGALYFAIFLLGFVITVPLWVTWVNFENRCMLYAEIQHSHPYIIYNGSSQSNCNYVTYLSVFACVIYGLVMTIYYGYAITRRNQNTGTQMWVLPFILVNAGLSVATFISSCIISVGFKTFCDRLVKAMGGIVGCSYGQNMNWNADGESSVNGSTYYSCFNVAQIASWTCFLAFVAQVGLGILRFYRNRRQRSQDTTGTPKKPADMEDFASVEPTA